MPAFGRRNPGHNPGESEELRAAAMELALQKVEKNDPLVRLRIGAQSLKEGLYKALGDSDEKAIHVDTALGILGSLAGFSCVFSLYCSGKLLERPDDPYALLVTKTTTGKKYYFGNVINAPLIENPTSVWKLVVEMAEHLGCRDLPDVEEIAAHVAESVGGDDFGIPRMPPGHDLSDTPVKYVKYIWPKVFPDLEESTKDTEDIPILIGIAIQQVMKDSHEVIDPGMSARIAMECAVPMSKIDPYTVI